MTDENQDKAAVAVSVGFWSGSELVRPSVFFMPLRRELKLAKIWPRRRVNGRST